MENRQWVLDNANLHSVTDGRCMHHRRWSPQLENRQWVVDTADLYTDRQHRRRWSHSSRIADAKINCVAAKCTFDTAKFVFAAPTYIFQQLQLRNANTGSSFATTTTTLQRQIQLSATKSTSQQQNQLCSNKAATRFCSCKARSKFAG